MACISLLIGELRQSSPDVLFLELVHFQTRSGSFFPSLPSPGSESVVGSGGGTTAMITFLLLPKGVSSALCL